MGPDVAVPGKSDGVTFSCYLIADGRQQELMRRHHAKAEWIDYSFDLSPYAGKTWSCDCRSSRGRRTTPRSTTRSSATPRSPSEARPNPAAASLSEIVSTKAYRATADRSLAALSNTAGHGVAPSNFFPGKNRLEAAGDGWRFVYEGDDCRVVYTYTPATGTLDDFRVQVDDGPAFPARQPAAEPRLHVDSGDKSKEVPARGGKAVRVAREGDALNVLWEYDVEGRPLRIAWSYRIAGKALVVSARCDDTAVSRFSLGELGVVPLRKTIDVPYLLGQVQYLAHAGVFVCRYLDWTVSHASNCPARRGQLRAEDRRHCGTRWWRAATWPFRRTWARCCPTSRIRRRRIALAWARGSCSTSGGIIKAPTRATPRTCGP